MKRIKILGLVCSHYLVINNNYENNSGQGLDGGSYVIETEEDFASRGEAWKPLIEKARGKRTISALESSIKDSRFSFLYFFFKKNSKL
jgi:hypothetical protein